MQMIMVPVIIPVFNAEKYINECVDNVLCQTMDNLEIICIDDGSADNSLCILQE
ncbi:MAG: glycosyltransferase family 2 protein [Lachnospiraceae bacterium]|nr:glycosyltransferase family 2 protein [Lachnospiraceae bacterium]